MTSLSTGEKIAVAIAVIAVLAIFGFGLFSVTTTDTASQTNDAANSAVTDGQVGQGTSGNDLLITDITTGTGQEALPGTAVFVYYIGTLADGTVFDSNVDSDEPFGFLLGEGFVIEGWELGVQGMKEGGVRRLTVPASFAYGADGVATSDGTVIIPPNATLTFDIELVAVESLDELQEVE